MARPRKSERDAAGIRLANAFWTLLEHHRLANITVGMVAEQAELNRGTFYYHFKSMDDLVDRVIEDEILGNESVMQNVFGLIAGSSTVDSLETLINRKTDRFALLINQGGMDLFSVKIKRLVFATWKAILCDDGEELAPNTRLIQHQRHHRDHHLRSPARNREHVPRVLPVVREEQLGIPCEPDRHRPGNPPRRRARAGPRHAAHRRHERPIAKTRPKKHARRAPSTSGMLAHRRSEALPRALRARSRAHRHPRKPARHGYIDIVWKRFAITSSP